MTVPDRTRLIGPLQLIRVVVNGGTMKFYSAIFAATLLSAVAIPTWAEQGEVIESNVTIPPSDWRKGPPKQNYDDTDEECGPILSDSVVSEEQQDLNENSPPLPPNPNEDIYQGPNYYGKPTPPPGYENLTLPGEPPRQ